MRCVSTTASLCVALSLSFVCALAATLTCPQSIAEGTLTMACSAACPNALSPCLYFANAKDCVAEEDSGSVCVSSTLADNNCAIECFSPFSGSGWNLMLTDDNEYKRDVAAARTRDPTFQLAKKKSEQLRSIRDLKFPTTTKTISITGNALPIYDKAVDYPVIYHGNDVAVDMNFTFLASATQATTIIMENVNLTALDEIPLLPQLVNLQLANGKLHAIPSGIAALPALQRLDVSLNTLLTIPSGALPMTLVDLCLQDCGLESLPPGIANMTRLKKLDLAGNKFSLPAAGSLPLQVEHLIWWGFYHKRLPPDFPSMTKLKKLEIGWNDFSNAEALALLPTSLEELHLVETQLTELPTAFLGLTKLTWIDLAINSLRTVPVAAIPSNLKFLNMSVNWISTIQPKALPTCLETLDLHVNVLTCSSFPSDFTSLTSLKTLYLDANQLECVPPAIFSLSSLETLTLHQNPNMSRVTFNKSEIEFLSRLKSFQIDQRCLNTNCDSPTSIGEKGYTVCLTGTTNNSSSSSGAHDITATPNSGASTGKSSTASDNNRGLIIGLAVAIGGMVAILIGAVHWKKRREEAAAGSVMQFPADDGKGGFKASVGGDAEVCLIEAERREGDGATDATAYEEMKTNDTYRDTKTKTSSSSVSTKAMTASASQAAAASQSTTCSTTVVSDGESHGKKTKIIKKTTTTTTKTTTSGQATTTSSSAHSSVVVHEELLSRRVDSADVRELQLLSSSQSGEVSLAIHNSRHVVVKRVTSVHSESTSTTTTENQRFIEGVKLHSRLEHPRILELVGVSWTTPHDVQTVCEYMANGDLASFLASQQPKIETLGEEEEHHWDDVAIQIALDVAEALVYLHSLDPPVVHRNLKSRNVLLDEMLRAKISDFGGSQGNGDDATGTAGSAASRWTAPELLSASTTGNATSAADIYSLGVVLSELDTWSLPYADQIGVSESDLLSQVAKGKIQPRFLSCSPKNIVDLAKKCLVLNPKKRPTAAAVADALRQLLSQHQQVDDHVRGLAGAARGSTSSSTASVMAFGAAMTL